MLILDHSVLRQISSQECQKKSQQVIQVILCGFQCVIEKKNKEIVDLKDRVSLLESRVEELKDVVDSNSNYERRYSSCDRRYSQVV